MVRFLMLQDGLCDLIRKAGVLVSRSVVTIPNTKNLPTIIWFQVFLSYTNNLPAIIWF